MVVGIPNAGQVNALETLNIRGERSVTCKGDVRRPPVDRPAAGQLPRRRARRSGNSRTRSSAPRSWTRKYGSNPDLKSMPLYCVAMSFKDVYDAKDMRSTGGADVNYAMDAPPQDSTIVAAAARQGRHHLRQGELSEYNGGSGNPGGDAKVDARDSAPAPAARGRARPAIRTTRRARPAARAAARRRRSRRTSSMCSICEETGGSCRQPAWRNGVVALVTTKGMISYGGAIGADPYLDRPGIHCRTVKDAALVLDALQGSEARLLRSARHLQRAAESAGLEATVRLVRAAPAEAGSKPLAGMRIGIVREYMVKHSANDAAMSDRRERGDQAGAARRSAPSWSSRSIRKYPDDPSIPNMAYTFQQALAEIVPFHMPEDLAEEGRRGALLFAVPGYDVTRRDYMVRPPKAWRRCRTR